jgi:hypothetical protein
MWCWIKKNRTSVVWLVLIWMVTILVLAVTGPVVHP